eukprot:c27585_g1_i1 orf=589-2349(+)
MKKMLQDEDDLASYKRVKRAQDGQLDSQLRDESKFGASVTLPFLLENPPVSVQCSDNRIHPWNNMVPTMVNAASLFNPLDEPSPLGLSLKKSPSLLDLIQRKLAQADVMMIPCSEGFEKEPLMNKSKNFMIPSCGEKDKVKAANFPASLLRIGTWECASCYEGDLVAKCYYAKRKLVWEVLNRGLKSKIEVQWSDITALKASCSENQSDSLYMEISRPPLFFRETNPQPRKHTSWQSTPDFTGGQATVCRRHFLQFSEGILNRHLEKLFQCEPRLKALSERASTIENSLFFEPQIPVDEQQDLHFQSMISHQQTSHHMVFEGLDTEPLRHIGHGHVMNGIDGCHLNISPMHGMLEPACILPKTHGREVASPSSVIDVTGIEESSSSDSEDVMSGNDALDQMQVHKTKVSNIDFSCQGGPYSDTTNFLLPVSTNASFHWKLDNNTYDRVPRNMQAAERQVLNDIALHLLGEPLPLTEGQQAGAMPSVLAQNMCQAFSFVQHNLLDEVLPQGCEDSSQSHEKKINGWLGEHFCLEDDSKKLLPEGQMTNSELKPKGLMSHGSHVDLLYLPRISSLPQLFSSNCTRSYP